MTFHLDYVSLNFVFYFYINHNLTFPGEGGGRPHLIGKKILVCDRKGMRGRSQVPVSPSVHGSGSDGNPWNVRRRGSSAQSGCPHDSWEMPSGFFAIRGQQLPLSQTEFSPRLSFHPPTTFLSLRMKPPTNPRFLFIGSLSDGCNTDIANATKPCAAPEIWRRTPYQ
ncbi:hypothetical protein M752DRAFT_10832 [Aspergillus phoenicis ATCC 13157]|uniref:Uncharacterized protein n=1 Tax=Aspergillus phoenicis ATCC 13157 TaxID=1353007 RepID=A0A370Q106_ASPPH|nr:hypothetical protein M752DRAFT_10832 [Aspergillus phoenicis ATCC 13157]